MFLIHLAQGVMHDGGTIKGVITFCSWFYQIQHSISVFIFVDVHSQCHFTTGQLLYFLSHKKLL